MQFLHRDARLSLVLILLAAGCSGTPEERWEAAKVRQTTGLPTVTRAEIFVVGDPDDDVPEPRFPIYPYENFAPILDQCELTGAKAEELAAIWRSCNFEIGGSLCHNPVYALRFYSDEDLVLETSLCWECDNCFLADGSSGHRWKGFEDIEYRLLLKLRKVLVPPPNIGSAIAVNIGAMRLFDENFTGARTELDDAVRLDPTNPEAYVWRAKFFEKTGETNLAIAEYTEGLKHIPPYARSTFLESRGKLHANAGDHPRAIKDFSESIELKITQDRYVSDLYLLRAESYDKLGNTAEAEADRKRAEPPPPEVYEFESTEDSESPEETETPASAADLP